jgi:hypothetical protein
MLSRANSGVLVSALFVVLLFIRPTFAADLVITYVQAPVSGSELRGTVDITLETTSSSPLQKFVIAVEATHLPHDSIDPSLLRQEIVHGPWTSRDAVRHDTIRVDWQTNFDPQRTFNGTYELSATATSLDGATVTRSIGDLKVNNPPQKPDQPSAYATGLGVDLRISGPEPDIFRYVIERSVAKGPFTEINAEAGRNACPGSFSDPVVPRDQDLRYRVKTVRASPVSPQGLTSPPSDPSDPVTISAVDTPTPSPPTVSPCTTGVGPGKDFFEVTGPHGPPIPAPTQASTTTAPTSIATPTLSPQKTPPLASPQTTAATTLPTPVPTSSLGAQKEGASSQTTAATTLPTPVPTSSLGAQKELTRTGGHGQILPVVVVAIVALVLAAGSLWLIRMLKQR